ncbi:hypothetical protein F0562_013339 [Nyssa sinensis]|uniref:Uncharacterized protein n=1 Tax=Nyssa sinensis TaxID=561372 RepID=A0A5J4ZJZ9_9ASTE|nr:hypothetical protein F0562_013339 [Nyssa sinensis]
MGNDNKKTQGGLPRDNDTSHDQMHWAAFDELEGKGGSKGDFVIGAPLSDGEQLDSPSPLRAKFLRCCTRFPWLIG